jgi:hypothetical protein
MIAQWKEAAIGFKRTRLGKSGMGELPRNRQLLVCGFILNAPLLVKSGNNRADKRENDQVKVHFATGRDIQTKRGRGGAQNIRLTFEKQTRNKYKTLRKEKKIVLCFS